MTYRIDRPEGGWDSWGLGKLDISIDSGGVLVGQGEVLERHSLGEVFIELVTVSEMSVRLLKHPVIHADVDEFVSFRVAYKTNFSINVEVLGNGEIGALRRSPTDDVFEFDGKEYSIARYVGPRLPALVVNVEPNGDGTDVDVDYRVDRPVDGWGESATTFRCGSIDLAWARTTVCSLSSEVGG